MRQGGPSGRTPYGLRWSRDDGRVLGSGSPANVLGSRVVRDHRLEREVAFNIFSRDIMEPVTYLSSLSMVILGYLWLVPDLFHTRYTLTSDRFLYQGREVSYSSMLDRSISTRRQALYKARDFDIDKWIDLMSELKGLRRELHRIAEDYDERRLQEDDKQEETEESQDVEEIERSIEDDEKERTSDERKS